MAARCKAKTGIVGSSLARDMAVCVCVCQSFSVLCCPV
jgi:hypothetical protein